MAKMGSLIVASFVTIGCILQIVFYSSAFYSSVVNGSDISWEIQTASSLAGGSAQVLAVSSILIFYLGFIFALGSRFVKGNLYLKIGGSIMILGILTIMISMLIGSYGWNYMIGELLLVLGAIFYFVGCIQIRKYNNNVFITGFLLFVVVICAEFIFGFIFPLFGESFELWVLIFFVALMVQAIIFTLHSWVLGFSKESVDYSDKVEDTLSVENGPAFASYVLDDMKKKKGKKLSESDEITFTF